MKDEKNTIKLLDQVSHVRKRPGLYCGDVQGGGFDNATINLVRELVFNSVDRFLNGFGDHISIHLDTNTDTFSICDDGGGISLDFDEEHKLTSFELAMTKLNAGSNFDKDKEFKVSLGTNAFGAKVVNYLSDNFIVRSYRNGICGELVYSKGLPVEPLKKYEYDTTNRKNGLYTSFKPDLTKLSQSISPKYLLRLIKEVSYLNKGLSFTVTILDDKNESTISEFSKEDGLPEYLNSFVSKKDIMFRFPTLKNSDPTTHNSYEIELAISDNNGENLIPYVNGTIIGLSSRPVALVRRTFANTLKKYIDQDAKMSKADAKIPINTDDMRSGLYGIIKFLHYDPQFDSQTKTKLVNEDITDFINEGLPDQILEALRAKPDETKAIIAQAIRQAKARLAADKARKASLGHAASKKKVISYDIYTPPSIDDPENNTLCIFEGQSASGTLVDASKMNNDKGGKYRDNLGILSLKGIPLNCWNQPMSVVLTNVEMSTLITVLGLDPRNPDDMSGLKFHKIALMSDSDAGGAHIFQLITAFFLYHFPKILEQGLFYRALAPFYEVKELKTKTLHFCYSAREYHQLVENLGYQEGDKSLEVKRNKGLGSLSPQSALELAKNPKMIKIDFKDDKERSDLTHLISILSAKDKIEERRILVSSMIINKGTMF